ncbi:MULTISPECIES: hypothetical protein [unclassified Streptomyces]|uniref:hypothetical protein n=1 Tax=unclassified Streptomyces TaxID=2593676 RepID=UPI0024430365|nr:hypothetical protein [Streptomyces sp. DH41]MDG9724608.1 hypothetical protein [Streptomyces sp. DH41]
MVHGSRVLVSSTGSHRLHASVRPGVRRAPAEYPGRAAETGARAPRTAQWREEAQVATMEASERYRAAQAAVTRRIRR